jgi:uncharacterized protein YegP (UPF0339 family)
MSPVAGRVSHVGSRVHRSYRPSAPSTRKRLPVFFEIYRDKLQQYRWRLYAQNFRVIADSGEGYWNKADCLRAIELVKSTNSFTNTDDHS